MRIGQLAQIADIDTQTIRFYEQQGLLPPPERQENGYRVYTEKHGEWLAFIRRCRILDLSLAEIRELQSYRNDPRRPCSAINEMLNKHVSDVRSGIATLQELEKQLVTLKASCDGNREVADCGILSGISEESHQSQHASRPGANGIA